MRLNALSRRVALGLFLFVSGSPLWCAAPLKVMTRNMDAGTDMGYIYEYFSTDPMKGVWLTYQEILQAQLPERAGWLADEIAAQQPDLVSLQEVTTWRTGRTMFTCFNVLYDQLDLLREALAQRGLHYRVVAINTLFDMGLPMSRDPNQALRITDRDVLLARVTLDFTVSNVSTHIYQTLWTYNGLTIQRGWIQADVTSRGGNPLRIVDTHLETPEDQNATDVQVAQADELIAAMAASPIAVLIAGDFNANAYPNGGGEHTPTTGHMLQAGYTDVWYVAHPDDPGLTWALYNEDQNRGVPVVPSERIDLMYSRWLAINSVERTGMVQPWPSDHAGVVAVVTAP